MNREPLNIRYIRFGAADVRKPYNPHAVVNPMPNALRDACDMAGITVEDARGSRKDRDVAFKRFHVMAILREWGRSAPHIGRMLGGRDHSTVVHGWRRWEEINAGAK